MKKIILSSAGLIMLSAALFTTQSCKKTVQQTIEDIGDIEFSVPISETAELKAEDLPQLPQLPPEGLTIALPPIATATNVEQNLKEYNTSEALVEEVKLKQFDLTMKAPPTQNFDIVDSLWMYISAPGLDQKLAAYKFDIPKGQKQVMFDLVDVELKDYFVKDSIYVTLKGHFYEAPQNGTVLQVDARFDARANPLNK